MPDTPRITRSAYTGIPRWRTSYRQPTNWTVFKFTDFVIMGALMLFWAKPYFGGLFFATLVLLVFRVSRLLGRRRRLCEAEGHVPYRPIPEVAEWRCRRCTELLDGTSGDLGLDEAIREVERNRPYPQARYSDRR